MSFISRYKCRSFTGDGSKPKRHIEGPCGFVLGMREQGANADNVGRLGGPQNRVFDQPAAKTAALFAQVDSQPGKQNDRYRIPA